MTKISLWQKSSSGFFLDAVIVGLFLIVLPSCRQGPVYEYDGTWDGTTNIGKDVYFLVEKNVVTMTLSNYATGYGWIEIKWYRTGDTWQGYCTWTAQKRQSTLQFHGLQITDDAPPR